MSALSGSAEFSSFLRFIKVFGGHLPVTAVMKSWLSCLLAFSISHLATISCDQQASDQAPPRDYCLDPETPSQLRLLSTIEQCSLQSQECNSLSDCLSENLVRISEETMITCRKAAAEGDKAGTGFRPCSVAATAYVILEQIRRLLIEETIYQNCTQVKRLFETILRQCGGDEGVQYLEKMAQETKDAAQKADDKTNQETPEESPQKSRKPNFGMPYHENPNMEDMLVQEILAKFLVGIGKKMQTFDSVREDIAELERSKHMKALGAMCVSFALPGLLGLCEAAHFRTGLVLQILALFIIGIYQFSRYGGYWAFVGVGSCLLIMIVELGLMVLVKKRLLGDSGQEPKKTE